LHDVLDLRDLLADELTQQRESGGDVSGIEAEVVEALASGASAECLSELLDAVEGVPRVADWPYEEPTDAEAIIAAREPLPELPPLTLSDAELLDRTTAAWLGRAAGCILGKPVESIDRVLIREYLQGAGEWPLNDYIPMGAAEPEGWEWHGPAETTTRGNIVDAARDDDLDYTVLGLLALEQHGFDFTPEQIGRLWLQRLPFLQTYTAERAAYRNLLANVAVPQTATVRNPYREWIGAQIRADIFGYVAPGDPEAAASLAYRDAALSHVGNGIYGEQWAAGLIAAAFTAGSVREALDVAYTLVPPRSRLAEALRLVDELHARDIDFEAARDALQERLGDLSFVHTINNAAVVAAALLWGDGDFTQTICLAVQAGWDTDCNGATVGSVFGAMHGTAALPDRWIAPLNDTLRSAIFGCDGSRISDLAQRTVALAQRRPELVAGL